MFKIHVEKKTARLEYVLDFIFSWSDESYRFKDASEADFIYSTANNPIGTSSILFEDGVRELRIEKGAYLSEPCFEIDGKIDPLATIFLCLTRYEEYGSKSVDEHNRFRAESSWLYQFGWLQKAVADRLRLRLLHEWKLNIVRPKIKIVPTFDIDNTYAYKEKGFRSVLSSMRDQLKGDKKRIQRRKSVVNGEKDPYDTFEIITEISKKFETYIFWLLADWSSKDRNVNWKNQKQQDLINSLSEFSEIGIHPGYKSFLSQHRVVKEINRLKEVLGTDVSHSRQHFLRCQIPESYRILLKSGIHHDHTMGYASRLGFRAGTSSVFNWFDLESNQVTELKIHPFLYMDGTLNEYLNYSVDESKHVIQNLFDEVSSYGEVFEFLWHNETIGDQDRWEGWKDLLTFTLNLNNE